MRLHGNAALSWSGRRRLAERVVVEGWTLKTAAEAAGVSLRCARKWVGRYRLEGERGLLDRSSRPRRVANRTPEERIRLIVAMRRLRYNPTQSDLEGKRRRSVGYEYVHVCVDDYSRLAYAEVLPDEKTRTAIGFLERAVSFYRRRGIRVERLLTDNGSAYVSAVHA